MQTILQTFVSIVAVGGFVMWSGLLYFSDGPTRPYSFERVASLVLLALLCTTLAALG